MDKTTISSLTYTVKQGSVSVPGTITYTGTNATFTPTSNLQYSTVYSGVITTGAKDMAGNALASNFTFSFTNCCGTRPYIANDKFNRSFE